MLTGKRPGDLGAGPGIRLVEPDPAQERGACLALDGELAVTAQGPMAEHARESMPGAAPAQGRGLAYVAHHLGVGAERRVGLEIARLRPAQPRARRFQSRDLREIAAWRLP